MVAQASMPVPHTESRPHRVELLGYAAIALALLAAMVLNQRGLFVPDIKPEVYLNPWERLRLDLSTWLPVPYLGTQNYNLGLAPVDLVSALIQSAGVPGEAAVRVLRYVLLLVAGAGAWLAFRRLAPDADRPWPRFAMVAFYVVNPYSVVAGSTLAILLPYALFPWFVVAVRRAMVSRSWPAAARAALVFALMTGMNVGAVPLLQLAALPALAWWLVWQRATTWGAAVAGIARTGVLCLALSLYWLVPAFSAMGTATAVVDNSETLQAISDPSGWNEVLRGLGLWPMYGGGVAGPWQPGFVPYLQNGAIILASAGLLVLGLLGAAWSRSRSRVLGVLLLLTVGALMVGLHATLGDTPAAATLRWVLDHIPGAMALRTTNKAGAGLALALALLVALAVDAITRRPWTTARRAGVLGCVGAIWLVAAAPVWTGGWNVGRWDIPRYWDEASSALDRPDSGRLWLVPGQVLAGYRWSTDSVDDVNISLLGARDSLVRTVLPTQDPVSSNLLYQADDALQGYRLPLDGLSRYARLLGVSQILVRNDVAWERGQGLPAGLVAAQAANDPGLRLSAEYGDPGENTQPAGAPPGTLEAGLRPLQVYDVVAPEPVVRAGPVDRSTVVAGDAAGILAAEQAGLIARESPVVYAQGLRPDTLRELTGAGRRWIITDSNRRTNVSGQSLTRSTSVLRSAGDDVAATRALGTASDQTTAVYRGITGLRASSYASGGFGVEGNPFHAVDGDPATAWLVGAFGDPTGQWLEVDLPVPGRILPGSVLRTATSPDRRITSVTAELGGQRRTLLVRPDGTVPLDLGDASGPTLRLTIDSVSGEGLGYVGIADLTTPIPAVKGARTPTTLSRLVAEALPRAADLDATPIDVVLSRVGSHDWFGAVEETSLLRHVDLPAGRSFRAYGVAAARPGGDPPVADDRGCIAVAQVDGRSVWARPLNRQAARTGEPYLYNGCDPLDLAAGEHEVAPAPSVVLDTLVLRDQRGELLPAPARPATVTVMSSSTTAITVTVDNPDGDALWLSTGTARDPGWRANVDGADLGAPVVVDGAAMGWRLPAVPASQVIIEYEPQHGAERARWISLGSLIVVGLLALLRVRRVVTRPVRARWVPSRWLLSLVVLAWGWWCLGAAGALVGGALAAVVMSGVPERRTWWRVALSAAVAVPFVWILSTSTQWGMISPALVADNPWPGVLAWGALTCGAVALAYRRATDTGPDLESRPETADTQTEEPASVLSRPLVTHR